MPLCNKFVVCVLFVFEFLLQVFTEIDVENLTQKCKNVLLMIQAQVDKQIAMATIEIERRHSHYGALLQRVKIVASHPLSKTGMGHAVGPERKFHGNPLVDGKLSSLPMVSEDSVITQIWPETLEQKIQPSKNQSLRFSSQETTAKSAATTNRGGIALEQESCSQVLKHALWS